jgi:hypothetical protein
MLPARQPSQITARTVISGEIVFEYESLWPFAAAGQRRAKPGLMAGLRPFLLTALPGSDQTVSLLSMPASAHGTQMA